jgi:glycosyltransferase involved in cell wall biosynthesis
MRIALVAPGTTQPAHGPDGTGSSAAGADRLTSLAQALAGLGHRVTVYARRDSRGLPTSSILCPGASLEYVPAGPAAPLDEADLTSHLPAFADYLAKRWRRNPPDVVDAHFWTSGLAALAGTRGLGVPVVQTFTSLAAAEQRHGLREPAGRDARRRLEAAVARSADLLLASSEQELEDLARLGAPRPRIRVVPCGVDTQRFSPEGPAADRNGRPRLVLAQPLTATRDVMLAVRALAEVGGAELVITGGPEKAKLRNNPARREIVQLARKLGVADRLVFTGRVGDADLPALLRSADLVVSTAAYEPVGIAALQAMACGTPVAACAAAGAEHDAVVDMTTGVHAPAQPAELARQIRRLLASPVRLEAYGIAAADRARSRYSWDRIARETVAAYGLLTHGAAAADIGVADTAEEDDSSAAEDSKLAATARRARA